MTGSIPTEIGNLTSIADFRASTNHFNGTLPAEIGYLTNLTKLYLHDNQLTGLLPTEIGFLTILNDFEIQSNMFTGAIPTEIGLMSSLSKCCLSETYISWPFFFYNFTFLTATLYFGKNNFTGPVPTEACNIATIFFCPPLICNCGSYCSAIKLDCD